MEIKFKADINFEADSIDDALDKLSKHFKNEGKFSLQYKGQMDIGVFKDLKEEKCNHCNNEYIFYTESLFSDN